MKRIFLVAMLAFTVSSLALGHAKDQGSRNVEQKLMQLEQELVDALVQNDIPVWDKYLADSFIFTAPDAAVQSKAEMLADLKAGALKMESSKNDDMKVRVYGNAAVVTYRSTDKGTYKGKDISGQNRWTDVFVKLKNRWQLVSTQGTGIAPK